MSTILAASSSAFSSLVVLFAIPGAVLSCAAGGGSTAPPTAPPPAAPPTALPNHAEAERVLDDWHDAAAHSDEERYFGHLTKDAIFIGTDATERWDVAAFRAYAHEPFSKGKGWVMHATARHIRFAPGGTIAWFDEQLDAKNLGPARGSGVLLYEDGTYRIAHYVLSISVPNEKFKAVKELLEAK